MNVRADNCVFVADARSSRAEAATVAQPLLDFDYLSTAIMETQIRKEHRFGFKLSEQDVRRIHQVMLAGANRICSSDDIQTVTNVRLVNGTVLALESIDDVLSLENSGQRAVEEWFLKLSPRRNPANQDGERKRPDAWRVAVRFIATDPSLSAEISVESEVIGTSRDWVVLVAGELEERLQKVRRISWPSVLAKPYISTVLLLASVLAVAFFYLNFGQAQQQPAYEKLEALRASGEMTDPIAALIFLEKERAKRLPAGFLSAITTVVVLATMLGIILPIVVKQWCPGHVFYWGENVAVVDRRRNVMMLVWTVIVLGLIVGVASTYLSKLLGVG